MNITGIVLCMKLVCFCRFAKTFETGKVATLHDVNDDGRKGVKAQECGRLIGPHGRF